MIKLENFEVVGWEHAIRGMRNPKNSWGRSDSVFYSGGTMDLPYDVNGRLCNPVSGSIDCGDFAVGPNDRKLMTDLSAGGTVHAKYRRMIAVYVDITAPLYWWKEFDTYKVGTVANSCSTMHKIADKEFTLEDFSCEHLLSDEPIPTTTISSLGWMTDQIKILNIWREVYLETQKKLKALYTKNNIRGDGKSTMRAVQIIELQEKLTSYWRQMIQLLPSSYNQKRTIMLNYEVLANIYKWRKNHKLDEWHEFCEWIEKLPYSEIVTGGSNGGIE